MSDPASFKGETGTAVYKELYESFATQYSYVWPIVDVAGTLFRQATEAFDHNLLDAAAILCRATVESLFYAFLTLKWDFEGMLQSSDQFDLTGDWRIVYYRELAKAMKKRKIFSKAEWKIVERIRDDGNYSAHLGSLQRQREVELLQEMGQIQLNHRKQGISIEETAKAFAGLSDKHKVSMSEPRALRNLRDTALIYSRIVNSIKIPESKKAEMDRIMGFVEKQ